jgi:hypothetical protein
MLNLVFRRNFDRSDTNKHPIINRRITVLNYTFIIIFISTMSDDNNPSKQAEADASPNVEPDHVEGAPNANNLPLTAFCRKKQA